MVALPKGAVQPSFNVWHGVTGVGGYRERAGYHGKGSAVDLNYRRNGYAVCDTDTATRRVYGGEAAGANLLRERQAFIAACQRTCSAIGVRCDLSARKDGESTGAVWDRWHAVSEAVRAYLTPYFPDKDDYDAGDSDVLPGIDVPVHMMADYYALRVPLVVGSPTARPRLTRNPAKGLMNLKRPVVVALCDVGGMRWGACDFGPGSSGDIMHFDDAKRIPGGAI